MSNTRTNARVAAACAMALLSGSAFALTTLDGTTVRYTFEESELGVFGSASVVGDSLVFAPSGFIADGNNNWIGHQLNVTVEVLNPLHQLSSFSLAESGGYRAYAADNENILIGGGLTAIDKEGDTSNRIFSAIVASGLATGDGNWTGAAAINLPAGGWGGVDGIVGKVDLQLFNDLVATDLAEVWKLGASITAVATPVPEADTYGMLLAGLGLVGFAARRRLTAAA